MSFKLADVSKIYEKDINLKREDVKILMDWCKKQSHLPLLTELQVVLFLHSCYYHIEEAKSAIENYFAMRTNYWEIFEAATENVIRSTLSKIFIRILPKRTPEDYIILVVKLLDSTPQNYNNIYHVKLVHMVMTLYIHQYGTAEGVILLSDMSGYSLGHIIRLRLTAIKQIVYFLQEGAPIRLKGLHLINTNYFTEKLLSIVKPFMKKEVVDMMHIHSNSIEPLYQYVPRQCLPKDYGGEIASIQRLNDENLTNVLSNQDFFKWHNTQKIKINTSY